MSDTQEVGSNKHGPRPEVDGRFSTGEETPNHGLIVHDGPPCTHSIPRRTVHPAIQQHVAEIGCYLQDGAMLLGWRRPGDVAWRAMPTRQKEGK